MTHRSKKVLTILAVAASLALHGCFVEPYWLKVTRLDLPSQARAPGLEGLTVVFLADLHLKSESDRRGRWVLKQLEEIRPDLILVGGDTLDDPANYAAVIQHLSAYRARLGIFVVPGNWEYWTHLDLARMRDDLAKAGVTLLRNERQVLPLPGGAVEILGVDDNCSGHDDLPRTLKDSDAKRYRIVLTHAPAVFDDAAPRGIDLTLAGHTHGGQIIVPCLGPCWLPHGSGSYVRGRYDRGDSMLFVTSGVGTSVLPVRFNCRPEIVVIRWGRDQSNRP